jgi:aspartate aminotransferase-like enzyme
VEPNNRWKMHFGGVEMKPNNWGSNVSNSASAKAVATAGAMAVSSAMVTMKKEEEKSSKSSVKQCQ